MPKEDYSFSCNSLPNPTNEESKSLEMRTNRNEISKKPITASFSYNTAVTESSIPDAIDK